MFFQILFSLMFLPVSICYGENVLPDNLVYGVPHESDLLLSRRGFSVGYCNSQRQALWSCYILSADNLIKEQTLCVITGPIFTSERKCLGQTDIPIPSAFYKVILDMTLPMKMIGFIVPNETTKCRLHSFVVAVDAMEKITGYDFFSELPDEIENKLESSVNFVEWQLPAQNQEINNKDMLPKKNGTGVKE